MIPVLTPEEMTALDGWAIADRGIPAIKLMEDAGRAIADRIVRRILADQKIVFLAGPGNNGGDACVAARVLLEQGIKCRLLMAGVLNTMPAQGALSRYQAAGGTITDGANTDEIEAADVIVDGIFGTGLKREPQGMYKEWIAASNKNKRAWKVAIDIPSGLCGKLGRRLGESFRADLTIALQCPKTGFFLASGPDIIGNLDIVDIGIPVREWTGASDQIAFIEASDFDLPALFRREKGSFKNVHGHVGIIGGSPGMVGAVWLAARASYRVGAGLVTAVFPRSSLKKLAKRSFLPDALTEELPDRAGVVTDIPPSIRKRLCEKDALGIGCGLKVKQKAIDRLLGGYEGPLIVDAGALVPFSKSKIRKRKSRPIVLTPHPGELSRLSGVSKSKVVECRFQVARETAKDLQACVVLKGAYSIIASPDGRLLVNSSGNPGMATAGMGDVLTGMCTGIFGQRIALSPFEKVALSVWLHGRVGDFISTKTTETAMMASDMVDAIPELLKSEGVR